VNDFVSPTAAERRRSSRAFNAKQLQALAYMFVGVHDAGYLIGLVFFGLGSTVFAYLWLAAWGIFSSLVAAIVVSHHGVPQFSKRLGTALLCADFCL
jgi:4-amino-4-deoxy-L-arabinose transferase-like glycosyltransferase